MNKRKIYSVLVVSLFLLTTLSFTQVKKRIFLGKSDLLPKISGPMTAFPGSSLRQKIRVGIKNGGTFYAKNFSVDLVLSKDQFIPVKFATYSATFKEDCLLKGGREFVKQLKGKSTMYLKLNGTNMIPADTPPGYYYLAVVVDPGKKVAELNEENNVAMFRIRILNKVVQKPDLIVRAIQVVNNCKIRVTLKNIGQVGVPASFYSNPNAVGVQMYLDGKPWGGIILQGFDPAGKLKVAGGIASHIWFPRATNLNLPGGQHKIKVVVDNNNNLPEIKENNNSLIRTLGCKPTAVAAAPKRFLLNFKDAYLVYSTGSNSIQITTQNNVLSYGQDWQKKQLKPYLYDLKQNVWKGFYWRVNTSRKIIRRMTGNNFGKIGDSGSQLTGISVEPVGGSNTVAPNRFFLRFKAAYLVYVPATKVLQITTVGNVLSYGQDWKVKKLKSYLYHLKQKFWKGFYWKVNTSRKQAFRVNGGTFGTFGGAETLLNTLVKVVN
jgi:hypothetical protein